MGSTHSNTISFWSLLFFIALSSTSLWSEPPISLSNWELQRARYGAGTMESQTVTMSITVSNSGDQKLSSVKTRLIFYTEKGKKIRATKWTRIGSLTPSQSERLEFKEGRLAQFPAFACEVSYSANGKSQTSLFHSSNHLVLPQLIPETPYEGMSQLIIMGQQIQLSSVGRSKPKVSLWVKNIGALEAIKPMVTINLLGKNKALARQVEQPLLKKGKNLNSGKEVFVDIVFKKGLPREFSGYSVSLKDDTPVPKNNVVKFDEAFVKGEVSLGHFSFTYEENGGLTGQFSILNDTQAEVTQLDAIVNLLDAIDKTAHSFTVPLKNLKAGEKRELKVSAPKGEPFDYLDFGITTYGEPEAE